MIDASCLLVHRLRQENSCDDSKTLGTTLSEENGCAFFDELRSVHESESYRSLVLRSQVLLVQVDDLSSLSNDTTMDYSLIVRSYTRCVMQNHNFSFEIVNGLGLRFLVNQNHTLPEVVSLELLLLNLSLDGKTHGLSSASFLHIHSLMVNTLDLHWIELSLLVRSEQESRTWEDGTSQERSSHDNTHTSDLVEAINQELYWVSLKTELPRGVHSTLQY